MKNLLVIAICLTALGVILTGCDPKAPAQIDQPVEATTTKTDAGQGGDQAGGGMVADYDIDR